MQGLIQWIVLLGYDEEVADGSDIESLIRDDAFAVERNEAAIERFELDGGYVVVHTTFPILWDGEDFVEPDEFWSEFFNNHPALFKGGELAASRLRGRSMASGEVLQSAADGDVDNSGSLEVVPSLVDRCRVVAMVPAQDVLDLQLLADTLVHIRSRLERNVHVEAILGLLIPDEGF